MKGEAMPAVDELQMKGKIAEVLWTCQQLKDPEPLVGRKRPAARQSVLMVPTTILGPRFHLPARARARRRIQVDVDPHTTSSIPATMGLGPPRGRWSGGAERCAARD